MEFQDLIRKEVLLDVLRWLWMERYAIWKDIRRSVKI